MTFANSDESVLEHSFTLKAPNITTKTTLLAFLLNPYRCSPSQIGVIYTMDCGSFKSVLPSANKQLTVFLVSALRDKNPY
jgi:hypothetical protein